jgi:hypothetical protein
VKIHAKKELARQPTVEAMPGWHNSPVNFSKEKRYFGGIHPKGFISILL